MKKIAKSQPGFTFVELMFAIVVLGTMLSITMSMVVGMLRFYSFSNQIRQNQENGRNILDTMSRDIRFGKMLSPNSAAQANSVCIVSQTQEGNKGIEYSVPAATTNLVRKVWDNPDPKTFNCGATIDPSSTKTLNLPRMKVANLAITRTRGAATQTNPTAASAAIINFTFITGNPNSSGACDVKNIYCNKLEYNTVVNMRQANN
jgi:prepilin-type N-terminal cleavage/methylation domain-containing protein